MTKIMRSAVVNILLFFGCIAVHAQTIPGRVIARYDGQTTFALGGPYNVTGIPDSITYSYSGARRNYDLATTYTADTASHTYHITAYQARAYTPGDSLLTDVYQTVTGGTAVNSSRTSYGYDGANNDTLIRYETWNAATSSWTNAYQSIYTFNTAGKKTGWLTQTWNSAGNAWRNNFRWIYQYDGAGNDTSEVRQSWISTTSTWKNVTYTKTSFTAFNKISYISSQRWNDTNMIWKDSFFVTNYYNGGNKLLATVSGPVQNGTALHMDSVYNASLNATGLPLLRFYCQKQLNGFNSPYQELTRYIYTYNAANQVLTNELDYIDASMNTLNSLSGTNQYNGAGQPTVDETVYALSYGEFGKPHTVYYYEQSAAAVKGPANRPALQINAYPSPATSSFTVSVDNIPDGGLKGTLADFTGKVWQQWSWHTAATYAKCIEVSELPAGAYYVRLTCGRYTGSKIIIVQH